MVNINFENLIIILIIIITIIYLIIRFKKNKENFEDITYDILTSSSSNPINIKDIDILNNLECDNLILDENTNTNINTIDFTNSNLSNIKINNLEKNISNIKNDGKLFLNDKINISNASFNDLNISSHYSIDNIDGQNLKIIQSNEKDSKGNIQKLFTPNTIKYNNKTLYLTKVEYLDGAKKREQNGLKWKK